MISAGTSITSRDQDPKWRSTLFELVRMILEVDLFEPSLASTPTELTGDICQNHTACGTEQKMPEHNQHVVGALDHFFTYPDPYLGDVIIPN